MPFMWNWSRGRPVQTADRLMTKEEDELVAINDWTMTFFHIFCSIVRTKHLLNCLLLTFLCSRFELPIGSRKLLPFARHPLWSPPYHPKDRIPRIPGSQLFTVVDAHSRHRPQLSCRVVSGFVRIWVVTSEFWHTRTRCGDERMHEVRWEWPTPHVLMEKLAGCTILETCTRGTRLLHHERYHTDAWCSGCWKANQYSIYQTIGCVGASFPTTPSWSEYLAHDEFDTTRERVQTWIWTAIWNHALEYGLLRYESATTDQWSALWSTNMAISLFWRVSSLLLYFHRFFFLFVSCTNYCNSNDIILWVFFLFGFSI